MVKTEKKQLNKKKPLGLNIIIGYFVLTSLILFFILVKSFDLTGTNRLPLDQSVTMIYSSSIMSLSNFYLILIIVMPILIFNIAIIAGLYYQKMWGWWLTVVYSGLNVIFSLYSFFKGGEGIINLIISLLIIGYLANGKTKKLFG